MGEQGARASSGGSATGTPMIGKAKTDEEMGIVYTPKKAAPKPHPELIEGRFENAVFDILEEAGAILITKHRDYGPKNISLSPGGPLNGLRVRMWDKIARINNLIETGASPQHESLRDSWIDVLNYAAIAVMCIDNRWPSE